MESYFKMREERERERERENGERKCIEQKKVRYSWTRRYIIENQTIYKTTQVRWDYW